MRFFPDSTSSLPSESTRKLGAPLSVDERLEMTRFLQQLVRTPSVSGQEAEIAALIESRLRAVGVKDVQVDGIGNVIARLGDDVDGPTLLYDTHMDTVSATEDDWPHDPYEGVIEGEVLYGLGAGDAKGHGAGGQTADPVWDAAQRAVGVELRGSARTLRGKRPQVHDRGDQCQAQLDNYDRAE